MEVRSVCCYCATGCGVIIETDGVRITGTRGDPDHPTNHGLLCAKGRTLWQTVHTPDRALYPLMRMDRSTPFQRVTWEHLLAESTAHFAKAITRHGPDAVAFYVSGQLLTEDYYVFNKLMKGFIGSNNIDSNSRLCMSSAVAAYKRAFGVDGPPCCYDDIVYADNLFLFGANPAYTHPILFGRLQQAREEHRTRVVVVDPRRTDTCNLADLHLAIVPGSDVALLTAMLNVLVFEGLLDETFIREHTTGFEETLARAKSMSLRRAAELCGVSAGDIVKAALWFAEGATLSLWTMGFNQSTAGVDKNNALINLHLATGQIGKPGTGPFSLTGQPNAMGGRETGSLANLLPAHRDLANAADRDAMTMFWGGGPISPRLGLTATEMIQALEDGRLKALWVVCTNPAVSLPDTQRVRRALENAEWLMVSDAYHPTDTTRLAHAVLPAAGWGEKEGTMTNAERRIARVRRAVQTPGEALPDWQIAVRFARALGSALQRDWQAHFAYHCAEDVWNEHRRSTAGRDCDVSQLSYAILDTTGPQQWPFMNEHGTPRLYTEGRFHTPDGKARFIPVDFKPVARPVSKAYPFSLITGRVRDHWHTMTKTSRVPALNSHAPVPMLLMHPSDAQAHQLESGELVDVHSELGKVTVPLVVTTDMKPGVVFLPMHWSAQLAPAGEVNALVFSVVDPISKQPEYKHCPVRVERSVISWRGILLLNGDHTDVGRRFLLSYRYATCVVEAAGAQYLTTIEFGDTSTDTLHAAETADAYLSELTSNLMTLDYNDRKRGFYKRLWVHEHRLEIVRWIGFDLTGIGRLKNLMLTGGKFTSRAELFAA